MSQSATENATEGGASAAPGPSLRERLRERAGEIFGLDLRSLAAMRIGLGITLLMDLWVRSHDLATFYSDDGVMPREALLEHFSRDIYVSLHLASGTPVFQGVLFVIAAIAAVCLTVGYRTWLATLVSWALLVSIQVRMPLVLQSGDVVLRLVLFWCLFLPLGARASVDALQSPSIKAPPRRYASIATLGLMFQLSAVYIFTAVLKSGNAWWNGTAAIYALQIDHFATPVAKWMLTWPDELLWFGTGATLFWEYAGPAFLLVPFAFGPVRTLTVFGFYALHIGFRAALDIGLFSQICMVAWTAFLPGWFWDRFTRWPGTSGPAIRTPASKNALAAFFLALILSWNLSTVLKGYSVPSEVRWVGRVLRLDQKWNMFAPYPMKDDGWFVMPGTLRNGTEVDLWRDGAPVTYEKPELVSAMYANQRWRKYMRNVWLKKYKKSRLYLGKWVCRSWNADHRGKESLKEFKIIFMREDSLPNREEKEPRQVEIWTHDCFKKTED